MKHVKGDVTGEADALASLFAYRLMTSNKYVSKLYLYKCLFELATLFKNIIFISKTTLNGKVHFPYNLQNGLLKLK